MYPKINKIQTFYIYKLIKVVIIYKYQDFIFITLKIIALCLKSFNNSLKLSIISFILRFKLKNIILALKFRKLNYFKLLTFNNFHFFKPLEFRQNSRFRFK